MAAPELDLQRLFGTLVETPSDVADAPSAGVLPPTLSRTLDRLAAANRVWRPGPVKVPVLKRKIDIPYAYQNGVLNYVKPFAFAANRRAESQAEKLAIEGDLIQRHPEGEEERRLIVVSTREARIRGREITQHVAPLFKEYHVRLVRPSEAEKFAQEIEQAAH